MGDAIARPRTARGHATKALISVGLLALCVATFAELRHHDFADLDDLGGIQHNPDLAVSSPGESLHHAFTRPLLSNWIPVTALSHQLDRRLYGADAGRHLLTNLGLQTGASILLFLALAAMTGAVGRSAFVAAVFAVHPLHVETVAWISERKGVLSGFFFALTLLAHARYAKRPTLAAYAGVLVALALALLSKPTTVTLPCVLLLLDAWPLRRLDRRAWLEKLPMFALVLGASVATYLVQRETGAMGYGDALSLPLRVQNALAAYGTHLVKSFWPSGLAAFYPYPLGGPGVASVAFGAASLGLGTLGALRLRRSRPYLLVGWLWFVGMLVPMIGLVQVGQQSHADRYMYLPLIGLSIAVCWGVGDLVRSAALLRIAGVGAIALLALASSRQVTHWRDGLHLWQRVLAVNPGNARASIGVGSWYARRLQFEQAEARYLEVYESGHAADREKARELLRSFFLTRASHHRKLGDPEAELASLRQALRYAPDDASVAHRLGRALLERGLHAEARPHLEAALRAEPGDVRLLLALAAIAEQQQRRADALRLRREILGIAPALASNANDLAWLLATAPEPALRDPDEALRLAERVVAGVPQASANQLDTLAASHAAAGQFEQAADVAARALELAERGGHAELANAVRLRRALYLAGRPFVSPDT